MLTRWLSLGNEVVVIDSYLLFTNIIEFVVNFVCFSVGGHLKLSFFSPKCRISKTVSYLSLQSFSRLRDRVRKMMGEAGRRSAGGNRLSTFMSLKSFLREIAQQCLHSAPGVGNGGKNLRLCIFVTHAFLFL